jgi:hypothetical protein
MAKPHGHVTVNWIDDILEMHPVGPFNEEGTAISIEEMRAVANTRIKAIHTWQRLDVLNYETLGGPEVMKMIGRSYLWCFEKGCNAIATVYSTQLQNAILLDFIKETNTNMKGFDNKPEALAWLHEQHQRYLKANSP